MYSSDTLLAKLIPALVAVAVSIAGSPLGAPSMARADTKSWTAIKPHVESSSLVVGLDVDALRKTGLYAAMLERLVGARDPKALMDGVKAACNLDLPASINDITVAFDFQHDRGVIALGLAVDRARFDDCMTKALAKLAPGHKLAITTSGRITTYQRGTDSLPAAWLGKDVIVVTQTLFGSPSPQDLETLQTFVTSRPPPSLFAASIARANPNKPLWFAAIVPQIQVSELIGNLSIDATKNTMVVTVRAAGTTASAATKIAADLQGAIDHAVKKTSADAARLLKSVKIQVAGTNVTLDVAFTDKDASAVLTAFDKVF